MGGLERAGTSGKSAFLLLLCIGKTKNKKGRCNNRKTREECNSCGMVALLS